MALMFRASESNSRPLLRAACSGFAIWGHIEVEYLSLAVQSHLPPLPAPDSGSLSCSLFSAIHWMNKTTLGPLGEMQTHP